MTIYTVVRDVCAAVGVTVPNSIFASLNTNRTMTEMVALANEMAQRIAYDTRDWTMFRTATAFDDTVPIGTSGASICALPANYKRLLLTSNVRRSTAPQQPLTFIADFDQFWERTQSNTLNVGQGYWIIFSGGVRVFPPIATGTTVNFPYLDKNCIALASGGYGDRFVDDGDSFRLDERLLKLGMIWQWMANKGSPYAEAMGSYSDALANAMGHDQPAPILIDRLPISAHARVSGSWPAIWGPP